MNKSINLFLKKKKNLLDPTLEQFTAYGTGPQCKGIDLTFSFQYVE